MMTSKSKRFRILEQELKKLRKYFLPHQFDSLGNYRERQIALATAYRVLAHAEFESYLEDRVVEIAINALKIWKNSNQTTITLVSLFAFSGLSLDKPPDSLIANQQPQKILEEKLILDRKLGKAFNSFKNSVENNHGIREKNILLLLLPIGVNSEDLDRIWLQEIDDFGKKRGEFAHQSASNDKTRQPPDPKNELEMVNRLLQGLIHIDRLLNDLLKR